MPHGPVQSVLVVGAGPAGALAATLLARAGVAVTVLEQARFPRDKVCGECISDLGVRSLAEARLLGDIQRLRPVPLRRARLVAADGSAFERRLPAVQLGLTRRALDAALLAAARSAGTAVRQPARVERILPGRRPSIELRDLATHRIERLEADLLLLADGKSLMPSGKPRATRDLGIKAHFRAVRSAEDTIALFGLRGHYVGLAPVSDGEGEVIWNLAASVPAARLRAFAGDHDALLRAMCRENRALAEALAGGERISDWLASPLPRFAVRRDWPAGVIPIGNAAAALEPIGGEGIGLALASAALAARCAASGHVSPSGLASLRRDYQRLWRRRRLACRAIALALSRPRAAAGALALARLAPPLAALALRAAGKHSASRLPPMALSCTT